MNFNFIYRAAVAAALMAAPLTAAADGSIVNGIPWIEHIGSASDQPNRRLQYVSVNPAGRALVELVLETVNELSSEVIEQADLLPQLVDPSADSETVACIPTPWGDDLAYRIRYRYEGDEAAAYTPLSNGINEIHYWTDVMGIQRGSGNSAYSGGAYADRAPNGQQLRIADQTYAKGLCIPNSSSCVNTRSQNLRGYVRFKADCGLQYGSAGYETGSTPFSIANPKTLYTITVNKSIQRLNYTIGASGCNLNEANPLSFWNGKAGMTVVLGAARFYTAPKQRPNDQSISWTDHVDVMHNRPFVQELTATASSGLPVSYRVIEGNEYARVIDGNKLDVFRIPDVRDRIVVEAWQPGAHLYNAAPSTTCTFEMVHGLEVRPGQRAVLDRDETLQEICIYGDRSATGQVVVNGAMIDARKIVLKYTFIPGEWNHLTFPSDINLDQASDLSAKGYELNNPSPHSGGYFVQEFDTQLSAESPESSPWRLLDSPELKGRKGYVMKLSEGLGKEPVEVTFTFDNSQLNLKSEGQPMMVSFDLSQMRPFTSQDIYIKALGVSSNTLKVKLDFQPEHPEALPVNYEVALEQMRVTLTPDGNGLRLTLPNQEPARVAIFDRRGKRLLKAVSYVSPYLLDISDLKPGTYSMAVQYGDHTATRTFTVPKR